METTSLVFRAICREQRQPGLYREDIVTREIHQTIHPEGKMARSLHSLLSGQHPSEKCAVRGFGFAHRPSLMIGRISQIAKALGYQNAQMFETDGTLLVQHPWLLFDESTWADQGRPGPHSYFESEENAERSSFPRKSSRRPAIKAYILSLLKRGPTEQ